MIYITYQCMSLKRFFSSSHLPSLLSRDTFFPALRNVLIFRKKRMQWFLSFAHFLTNQLEQLDEYFSIPRTWFLILFNDRPKHFVEQLLHSVFLFFLYLSADMCRVKHTWCSQPSQPASRWHSHFGWKIALELNCHHSKIQNYLWSVSVCTKSK